LYQDFRFAFADIFLKRALSFIFLTILIFGIFATAVLPILSADPTSERSIALLFTMWALTALLYPILRRTAQWLIDHVTLRRVDYGELVAKLSLAIDKKESPQAVLDETVQALSSALSAQAIDWTASELRTPLLRVQQDRRTAQVAVATMEAPHYIINIRHLTGGRRLLSDDMAMLERTAMVAARRIDAVRSTQERYRRDLHEQEMQKLAAEAELRALRAQVNPHFLFNALTTIGYLIQTAPERALGTLMRLSGLLRGVLRTGEEFVTIGEELDLIEAYLDIERARFEDRLRVRIDVPWELRNVRIPPLVIQPIVENAIKHGISESVSGGEVHISARLEHASGSELPDMVLISVADTGPGVSEALFARRKDRGVGLSNVEKRLERYNGNLTPLQIHSKPGIGTKVDIRVPLRKNEIPSLVSSGESS
jgi:LytS/YehU family sensor histidine kinase